MCFAGPRCRGTEDPSRVGGEGSGEGRGKDRCWKIQDCGLGKEQDTRVLHNGSGCSRKEKYAQEGCCPPQGSPLYILTKGTLPGGSTYTLPRGPSLHPPQGSFLAQLFLISSKEHFLFFFLSVFILQ